MRRGSRRSRTVRLTVSARSTSPRNGCSGRCCAAATSAAASTPSSNPLGLGRLIEGNFNRLQEFHVLRGESNRRQGLVLGRLLVDADAERLEKAPIAQRDARGPAVAPRQAYRRVQLQQHVVAGSPDVGDGFENAVGLGDRFVDGLPLLA